MPGLVFETGSELYAGLSQQSPGNAWLGDNRNDNLLLTLTGTVRLTSSAFHSDFPAGTLLALEPGRQREFLALTDWECLWVHFNLDDCGSARPEWGQRGFCRAITLEQQDLQAVRHAFQQICQMASERRLGWHRLCYVLITEVILRGNMVMGSALTPEHIELAAQLLGKLDRPVSMDDIARRCSMSRAAFYTKFRETFGMSPHRYRENELFRQCRHLLETTDYPLKQIAEMLGCSSSFYLSNRFRKWAGISPSEYRRRTRAAMPPA